MRSRDPLIHIIQQHAEEAARLRTMRSDLVRAPQVRLGDLRRHDERLVAHLDGLAVAGRHGAQQCMAALESPGVGEVFAATVRAIEDQDAIGLDRLLALAEESAAARRGLTSAFGWVSAPYLQGRVAALLSSGVPGRRQLGIATCAMHAVDPGLRLVDACHDPEPGLRARALRTVGELGRQDLMGVCVHALQDEDPAARWQAASSAVLLGNRDLALDVLEGCALSPDAGGGQALGLWLSAVDLPRAQRFLHAAAQHPAARRRLIQDAGLAGNALYIPWLIKLMEDDACARLAGESCALITGLDLAEQGLERRPPDGLVLGPSEDPADIDVAMDPDEGRPWPDAAKVQTWWEDQGRHLRPGTRYFMGEPVNAKTCEWVLRAGYQFQRRAAAVYVCLLSPGTPLFPIAAPAWRQSARLAQR